MHKLYFLLFFVLFLIVGCSRPPEPQQEEITYSAEQLHVLLFEQPQDEDPGLYYYRNPLTRDLVEDFYYQVSKDRQLSQIIIRHAENNNIPLPLAFSLAWSESRFKPEAFNRNAGSTDRGLYQLNSKTFPFLSEEEFYNPEISAKYGLAHLRFCLEEGQSVLIGLAMYNAGTRGVRRGTPYSTLQYVAKTMEYSARLEKSFEAMLEKTIRVARAAVIVGDS